MLKKIRLIPFYLLLLPVFFILHGFSENFYFISVGSALLLIFIYFLAGLLLTGVFFAFLKRLLPASIIATYLLGFNFLFGNVQDWLKGHFNNTFLTKYGFAAFFLIATTAILCIILKKKRNLSTFVLYLNALFALLVLIDMFSLGAKIAGRKNDRGAINKESGDSVSIAQNKPDVYLILLDGYAGEEELKDLFNYDNSPYLDSLISRGFKVITGSKSNYNYTPYSTASMLNMEYLDNSKASNVRETGNHYASEKINDNKFVSFFEDRNYTFHNYSIFKVGGQAAPTGGGFVPSNGKLIVANTFLGRLKSDVLMNLATKYNWERYLMDKAYTVHNDNERIYKLTMDVVEKKGPKLVYTHLGMPHHPYYIDENGRLRDYASLSKLGLGDKAAYLTYLDHTNKKILQLVDHLLKKSEKDPVIAVFSDHGFRHYDVKKSGEKYLFSNLLTIHLPSANYTSFHDNMSNVNFLRVLLNTEFSQQLSEIENKTFFIKF